MSNSSIDYASALYKLLPSGAAWEFENGDINHSLLLGLATDFARLDNDIENIANDLNPQTSISRINDWLNLVGLPAYIIRNLPGFRSKQIVASLIFADDGNQSLATYYAIANKLAFTNIKLQMCDFNYNFAGMLLCQHYNSLYLTFDMTNVVYSNKEAVAGSKAGTKLRYKQANTNYLVDSLMYIYNNRRLANISILSNYYTQRDIYA